MPKYEVVSYTTEKGIAGLFTRLQLPTDSPSAIAKFESILGRAVQGRAHIVRSWRGDTVRLFGYDSVYIQFTIETPFSIDQAKSAALAGVQEYWSGAPVESIIQSITQVSGISEVFASTDFQWIVVGMGSGMTIGIVIFGLIRLLRG